jgi:hypothetical protein
VIIQINALSDYQRWKQANNNIKFSIFDYIYGMIIEKKIPIDFCIALFKLFYPEFIVIENHVFLKEEYEKEKYINLVKQNCQKKEIEYWMNLLNIDPFFFQEDEENNDNFADLSIAICEQMVDLWSQKLHKEFPDKQFCVKHLKDDEEVYITFYSHSN